MVMVMVNVIVLCCVGANYVLYTPAPTYVHPAPTLRMGRSLPLISLCAFTLWAVTNTNLRFAELHSQRETPKLAEA
jgi:hypothetical protein